NPRADASAAGESLYWKYESKLKQWDSELNTTIGAAGELFSIRTNLYRPVTPDVILDDFIISMNVASDGHKIIYEPSAFAVETASLNVKEELKRKIRIATGGIQAIFELKRILIPFRHPLLTFQYVSHRVLRWTIAPFLLILVFALNIILLNTGLSIYYFLFYSQISFYFFALLGYFFEKRHIKVKVAFVPYYFCA